jgi:hypothetical protein
MKRIFAISSLVAVLLFATLGYAAQLQPSSEKLSKQELMSLIANAKTPAEHQRLANYYQATAKDYLAESKMHEEMADQYRANALTSSSKFATGTVSHCEYISKSLKASAEQSQKLAHEHEEMAVEAQK